MGNFDDVITENQPKEPIKPMERCQLEIVGTEVSYWAHKDANGNKILGADNKPVEGKRTKVVIFDFKVADPDARCFNSDASPANIKLQVPVENHPYYNKEGKLVKMGVDQLNQLAYALGFEPVCQDKTTGEVVEATVSKFGTKYCPTKTTKQLVNPAFGEAYFDAEKEPKFGVFEGQKVYAKVDIESYKDVEKNTIEKFYPKEA